MMSLGEDDPEGLQIESAVEVTDETVLTGDCLPDCVCSSCLFKKELMKERHRISHLINFDPDKSAPDDDTEDVGLEIVHARVTPVAKVKRKKNSLVSISSQDTNTINNNESEWDICDNQSSNNSDDCDIYPVQPQQSPLNISNTIELVHTQDNLAETPPKLFWLGEREAPEGQEDPDKTLTECFNSRRESIAEVDDAVSLKTDTVLDEDFSIYDGLKTPMTEVNEDQILFQTEVHRWNSDLSISSSNPSYDCQKIEDIKKLQEANQFNDRSLELVYF